MNMSKATGWQGATARAREFYVLDTPPGSLLALMLHLIAARDEVAVADVGLAKVRYELSDPAALHEALNTHCPPIVLPDSSKADRAVPHWPHYPTADPVQMRRAWLLANANGPAETALAWPGEAQVIPYPGPDRRASFFLRAVDSLQGALDTALLAQADGVPLHSQVQVVGGAHDGLQGRISAVVWGRDDALRCVTVPASYRIYSLGVDAPHVPATAVRPLPAG
ncbi:hypothetical protein [Streptomyces sp. NPDC087294]|uniref:hypothetical protein n=1 Tax=Streptomyces sp. NPDC087294 TaxID=3365777 RepID=UPI0037F36293